MPLCTGGTVTERDIVSQKIRMINTRYRELIGTVVYRYRTGSGQVPGTNPVRYRYRHWYPGTEAYVTGYQSLGAGTHVCTGRYL